MKSHLPCYHWLVVVHKRESHLQPTNQRPSTFSYTVTRDNFFTFITEEEPQEWGRGHESIALVLRTSTPPSFILVDSFSPTYCKYNSSLCLEEKRLILWLGNFINQNDTESYEIRLKYYSLLSLADNVICTIKLLHVYTLNKSTSLNQNG